MDMSEGLLILRTYAEEMKRLGVRRFLFASGEEIELHESAFAERPAPTVVEDLTPAKVERSPDTCPCSHDEASHSPLGCLIGCTEAQCRSKDTSPAGEPGEE